MNRARGYSICAEDGSPMVLVECESMASSTQSACSDRQSPLSPVQEQGDASFKTAAEACMAGEPAAGAAQALRSGSDDLSHLSGCTLGFQASEDDQQADEDREEPAGAHGLALAIVALANARTLDAQRARCLCIGRAVVQHGSA